MSDLLSPIMMIMQDDAHAYVCFCALLKRLKVSFVRKRELVKYLSQSEVI